MVCLACMATYAQQTKKKHRKPRPKTSQARARVIKQDTTAAPVVSAKPPVDTAKVVADAPEKPFDRPLDGYFKKNNILNAKVTPYPNLREVDVAFEKRIWREIDLREKMNQYLKSPKQNLISILMEAIDAGELTAYDATPGQKDNVDGDGFSRQLKPADARKKLVPDERQDVFDKDNNKTSKMVAGIFVPDSIVKFRIKEDWIFDKQRSVFEPRIIGIAPLVKVQDTKEYQPAFWIYFPDARPILATKEVVSKRSDATGLSFDDVFMKRLFTSYIVKESNDEDKSIKDNFKGIDRLYEAERIKKELQDWELNLWQY